MPSHAPVEETPKKKRSPASNRSSDESPAAPRKKQPIMLRPPHLKRALACRGVTKITTPHFTLERLRLIVVASIERVVENACIVTDGLRDGKIVREQDVLDAIHSLNARRALA